MLFCPVRLPGPQAPETLAVWPEVVHMPRCPEIEVQLPPPSGTSSQQSGRRNLWREPSRLRSSLDCAAFYPETVYLSSRGRSKSVLSSTEGDFASPGRLGHIWTPVSVIHNRGLSPAPRGGDTAKHPTSHGTAPTTGSCCCHMSAVPRRGDLPGHPSPRLGRC